MIKFFKKIIVATLALLPIISFAANGGGLWNLFSIVGDILRQTVILLIGFAVIFFLYGILKYITAGDDEEKRTKMKNLMIYGIIGLFVMVSFWGIVNILVRTFQLDTSPYVSVPYFDSSGTSRSGSAEESWKDLEGFYGGKGDDSGIVPGFEYGGGTP